MAFGVLVLDKNSQSNRQSTSETFLAMAPQSATEIPLEVSTYSSNRVVQEV